MLLTIPTTPEKGEFQTYTLDVSDLIDLVTEEYYQDQENWRRVIVAYKSLEGNQLNLLSFTPDGGDTLTKQGYFAPESFSFFGIQSISIIDKQNGTYILTSSEIPDVANYNIIFVSADSAFFDMAVNYGAWMDISEDQQYIAVQSQYNSSYEGKYFYEIVMNELSSEINDDFTALVNNFKVDSYFFNADESKVYIAGKLGTNYLGETLPAIPVGSEYSVNPPRLISIDTVTLEVTYITTIKDAGPYASIAFSSGTHIGSIVVDEDSNVALMVGGGAITGYSIVSGDLLWFKSAGFPDGSVLYRKVELYTTGSFLVGSLLSYDGTNYSYYTPIKVNILTGNKDVSFPSSPQDGATVNSAKWALTPDKTKVVQQAGNDYANFYVFDGTSWSSRINYSGGTFVGVAMAVDNDYLYFLFNGGVKCDFTGLAASGFSLSLPFFYSFNHCIVVGSNLYADFGKFSAVNGARDTSFQMGGQNYYAQSGKNNSIYYMTTNMWIGRYTTPMGYNFAETVYGGYVGIINTTSRELENTFPATQKNPTLAYNPIFGATDSNILFVGNDGAANFKAYNFLTGAIDTSYPSIISSTNSIGNYAKDGDFMYMVSQYNGDSANTFNVTDSTGNYNLVTKLIRFNIVTKLVDQAFLPNIPSPFVGTGVISFTDDYIYLCAYYTGNANFCRVNKTTQAVEVITPSTLGISSPATWNQAVRIRASKIGTNKIVIYPDNASLKFDDKPYIICNEATLTQSGVQPATISQFPRYYTYNQTLNQLAGIFYDPSDSWHYITFEMSDNSKVTNFISANTNNSNLATSSGAFSNLGNTTVLLPYNDAYVSFTDGFRGADFRPYTGVIRMNPFGIINND